jgi:FKBP-type peptidyl-prolyl cis-trans isomerase SlpA
MGSGELAPTLEHCLVGINVGERNVFLLEPDQAFGGHNPQLVQRVGAGRPAAEFQPGTARPDRIRLARRRKFTGIVRELDDEAVLVDFNHPLAGKHVRFEVELIGIL